MHLNKFKAKNIFEMPKNLVQLFLRQSGMLERLRFLMFLSGKKNFFVFYLDFPRQRTPLGRRGGLKSASTAATAEKRLGRR